jgi:twitching motility protein PilI
MANKEALRDLQSRLAERMQQARTRTDTVQSWLAVECRGLGVLLPLEQAGEIHAYSQPTHVPHTRPWFRGVVNLRGALFGTVDIGEYLGLPALPDAPVSREQARLVALSPLFGVNCAIVVDRLAGLKRADQLHRENGTPEDSMPSFAGKQWVDVEGRAWQEIRLTELARDEQFLAVATQATGPFKPSITNR